MKNLLLKVILPLGAIIGMLAFVTLYNPIKQQNASWTGDSSDTCGLTTVTFTENNPTSSNTTYSGTAIVRLAHNLPSDNDSITIDWDARNYFCPTSADLQNVCGDNTGCYGLNGGSNGTSGRDNMQCVLSNHHQECDLTVPGVGPTGQFAGQVCGHYQSDFAFNFHSGSYGGNGCHYGSVLSVMCNPGGATYNSFGDCQAPTPTPTVPVATPTVPVATPTVPVATPTSGPTATPTNTPTATPTGVPPTATPTSTSNNNCDNSTQIAVNGSNNNSNCNQNNNNNSSNSSSNSTSNQTQNNNQSVNITLAGGQQQQQQQAVLGMTTLPKTGAESDILFGLLALIPVGWKLRKLV